MGEGQEYAGCEDGMGLVFRASLGALSVFIQDGDALIDAAFELPGLDFSGEASQAGRQKSRTGVKVLNPIRSMPLSGRSIAVCSTGMA